MDVSFSFRSFFFTKFFKEMCLKVKKVKKEKGQMKELCSKKCLIKAFAQLSRSLMLFKIAKELQLLSLESRFVCLFQCASEDELDLYFEVEATLSWIKEKNFLRVALQFPDNLLCHAAYVAFRLEKGCNKAVKFYILADTSYRRFFSICGSLNWISLLNAVENSKFAASWLNQCMEIKVVSKFLWETSITVFCTPSNLPDFQLLCWLSSGGASQSKLCCALRWRVLDWSHKWFTNSICFR